MRERESPTWTDERHDAAQLGWDLRVGYAEQQGISPGRASEILQRLSQWERREYHRSEGSRLSDLQRLELWRARSELAGRPRETNEALGTDAATTSLSYWHWLLRHCVDPGETTKRRRNWLSGDLVRAMTNDPKSWPLVEAAWRDHAATTGAFPEAETELSALRDRLKAPRPDGLAIPTERSHMVALLIAALSGFPPRLVELHRASRAGERAIIASALSAHHATQLESSSLVEFTPVTPQRVTRAVDRRAPGMVRGADGTTRLLLAGAELSQLDGDINVRALIEAVNDLRIGHAPREQIVYKKALGVWRERVSGRRDEGGDPRPVQQRTAGGYEPPPLEEEPEISPVKRGLASARTAVLLELESVYRTSIFEVSLCNVASVFPVDLYGSRLSADFGLHHVLAAHNCLRGLCTTATLSPKGFVVVNPSRHGAREITRHMARSAPSVWGGEAGGRQERRGFAGAVACIAQDAVTACALDVAEAGGPPSAGDPATQLLGALGQFCAVAVLDTLVGMLLRFRFTAATLRSPASQTARWHKQVRRTVDRMDASMNVLLADREGASQAGAQLLAPDLSQLGMRLSELPNQGPVFDLSPVVHQVTEMARAASSLTAGDTR